MFRLIVKLSAPLSIVLGVLIGLTTLYGESLPSWQVMYASQLSNGFWSVNEMDVNRRLSWQLALGNALQTPAISPNEAYRAVIYTTQEVTLIHGITGEEHIIVNNGNPPLFSPDSRYLITTSQNRYLFTEIFADGTISEPQSIIPGEMPVGNNSLIRWSPNSDMLLSALSYRVTGNLSTNLYLYSLEQDEFQTVFLEIPFAIAHAPAWSSDGQTIAYVGLDPETSNTYIYAVNLDGTNHQQIMLPLDTLDVVSISWSPDGTYMALISDTGLGNELYVMSMSDGETMFNQVDYGWGAREIVWSEDSQQLIFLSQRTRDLFMVNADGRFLTRLTDNSSFNVLLP